MWKYEKRLQFPVNIKNPNATLAQAIMSQYGGPDGELGASMRYLSQRYSMPYREVAAILTDIGTEELAHLEMVSTIVHQLTRNLSMEEIEESGFANYYVDHTVGVWPMAAGGIPLTAVNSSQKGMQLLTCSRTWLRSRKPAPRMIIFCVSSVMTRMYANRLNSCVPERLSTSSALEKRSGSFRINWIHRISISSILNLTSANHKEYHIKNVEAVIKGEVYILALS